MDQSENEEILKEIKTTIGLFVDGVERGRLLLSPDKSEREIRMEVATTVDLLDGNLQLMKMRSTEIVPMNAGSLMFCGEDALNVVRKFFVSFFFFFSFFFAAHFT